MTFTLIMMCSLELHRVMKDNAESIEFEPKQPQKGFFDKPDFFNKENLSLDQLKEQYGNAIDFENTIIVPPVKLLNPLERDMVTQKLAKNWFIQWCEIANYYDSERKKHITDELWDEMKKWKHPGEFSPGSNAAWCATDNAFRLMVSPLLNSEANDWFILRDLQDLDHPL